MSKTSIEISTGIKRSFMDVPSLCEMWKQTGSWSRQDDPACLRTRASGKERLRLLQCFAAECIELRRGARVNIRGDTAPLLDDSVAESRDDSSTSHPWDGRSDRLYSWKEVAAYLKRNVSTAQRWETVLAARFRCREDDRARWAQASKL